MLRIIQQPEKYTHICQKVSNKANVLTSLTLVLPGLHLFLYTLLYPYKVGCIPPKLN